MGKRINKQNLKKAIECTIILRLIGLVTIPSTFVFSSLFFTGYAVFLFQALILFIGGVVVNYLILMDVICLKKIKSLLVYFYSYFYSVVKHFLRKTK